MAFSTQKDFLKIGFLNQELEPACVRKTGVKLKSYASTTDSRAWAMNRETQAHFLADLVACRNYADENAQAVCEWKKGSRRPMDADISEDEYSGDGEDIGGGDQILGEKSPGRRSNKEGDSKSDGTTKSESAISRKSKSSKKTQGVDDQVDGDSLIWYAQQKLQDINRMLEENNQLRQELQVSRDRLCAATEQNEKLKRIVSKPNTIQNSAFQQKLHTLKIQGKITEQDETELVEMQAYLGCKDKEYKILEAENNSLKILVEKLSVRAKLNKIPPTSENSTDVNYLQSLVNDLRQEIVMLRGIENEILGKQVEKKDESNKDAEVMEKIIMERNTLREQLAKMVGIEDKIAMMAKRAAEAECLEKELKDLKGKMARYEGDHEMMQKSKETVTQGLENGTKVLMDCNAERERLKKKLAELQKDFQNVGAREGELDDLKNENEKLFNQLRCALCKLQRKEYLQKELECTKKTLASTKEALAHNECQLQQFMELIKELESMRCRCDETKKNKIEDGHVEDLVKASKLALHYFEKEFCVRIEMENELNKCNEKIKNLKEEAKCVNGSQDALNRQMADLLKELESCKSDNNDLKEKNKSLNNKVKELQNMINKVNQEVEECKMLVKEEGIRNKTPSIEQPKRSSELQPEKPFELESENKASEGVSLDEDEVGKDVPKDASEEKLIEQMPLDDRNDESSPKNCCDDLKQLQEAIIEERNKRMEEKKILEDKLAEMSTLYEKAKEDSRKSLEEKEKSSKEGDNVMDDKDEIEKKASSDDINIPKERKDLLESTNQELEQKSKKLDEADEQISALESIKTDLQNEVASLSNSNAELEKKMKEKENELQALETKITDLENQLKECKEKLHTSENKEEIENVKKESQSNQAELDKLKEDLDRLHNLVKEKETDIQNAEDQLKRCRDDLNDQKTEMKKKISELENEKEILQNAISASEESAKKMEDLINSIEEQQQKNNELEKLLGDCETKLKDVAKEPEVPENSGDMEKVVENLKDELQTATNKVNDLSAELEECNKKLASERDNLNDELKECKKQLEKYEKDLAEASEALSKVQAQPQSDKTDKPDEPDSSKGNESGKPVPDKTDGKADEPGISIDPVKPDMADIEPSKPVKSGKPGESEVSKLPKLLNKEAEVEKGGQAEKLQFIHEKERKDLIDNHQREIDALKIANEALRKSLLNLKRNLGKPGEVINADALQKQIDQLKKGVCKCTTDKKTGKESKMSKCRMTEMQKICSKIADHGIECLNRKDLSYIQCQVYMAGLKLNTNNNSNLNRCPSNTPKEEEKKLLKRIMHLQNEVNCANQLLEGLKKDSNRARCSRPVHSTERRDLCRSNDEINEFLRRANQRKSTGQTHVIYQRCKKSTISRPM